MKNLRVAGLQQQVSQINFEADSALANQRHLSENVARHFEQNA